MQILYVIVVVIEQEVMNLRVNGRDRRGLKKSRNDINTVLVNEILKKKIIIFKSVSSSFSQEIQTTYAYTLHGSFGFWKRLMFTRSVYMTALVTPPVPLFCLASMVVVFTRKALFDQIYSINRQVRKSVSIYVPVYLQQCLCQVTLASPHIFSLPP